MTDRDVPRALTIAGSDSGGGAGIEADLKTFAAFGVYGMAAITSVTAQNTMGVFGVHDLSPDLVAQQIDVVVEDIGVDALKTGMLSNRAIVRTVVDRIAHHTLRNIVIDPVMVSATGHSLLQPDAVEEIKESLLPLALVVTPNIPEAESLTGLAIRTDQEIIEAARAIYQMGPRHVLIKGGHADTHEATDYLFDGEHLVRFSKIRLKTTNLHGTGCTFSAAIAALLAMGHTLPEAVKRAKDYVTEAIRHALPLGKGTGPLNHAWPYTTQREVP